VQIGDVFDEIIHNVGGIKGEQPGVYIITGPDYTGDIPGDMIQVFAGSDEVQDAQH
jgi:hypothetical protein